MRTSCAVYIRKEGMFVVSAAMTTHGFEIDDMPVTKLAAAEQTEVAIGKAVLKALDAYRKNVSPPGPNGRQPDPVLQFVGAKSWGQLERSSLNVFIKDESGSIRAVPTRRSPKGGYVHLEELAVHCRAIPEEIGVAVRKAVQLCS